MSGKNLLDTNIIIGLLNSEENISKISSFSNTVSIIKCDTSTSKHYGKIKAELKKKGKPIPENDIWIAALATQHNSTLVTRDKHFKNIDGLQVVSW